MAENRRAEHSAADWRQLHQAQVDLRMALQEANSDGERAQLKRQLLATRQAIARMSGESGGEKVKTAPIEREGAAFDDEGLSEFLDTLLGDEQPPDEAKVWSADEARRPVMWVIFTIAFALSSTYVLSLLIVERPEDGYLTLWDGWIVHLALLAPAALSGMRALNDKRGRAAWSLITLGIVLYVIANLVFTYRDQNLDPVPFPGWSDVLYLESTLALTVAMGLATHRHVHRVSRASRLNGLVIGLAAAAVAVALWFDTILEQSGSASAVLVGLAYPVFDLVFIVIALSGLSLARYRPSPSVAAFIAAAAFWAIGDVVFLRQIAADTYLPGTILDATWLLGIFFFGLACWLPQQTASTSKEQPGNVGLAFVPWAAALAALAVIGWSVDNEVPALGVWLAMASIVTVMVRIGLALGDLRQANEQFSQAWLGEVAGFRERPQLVASTRVAPPVQTNAPQSAWTIGFGVIAITALVGVGVLLWQIASDRGQSIEAARSDTTAVGEEVTGPIATTAETTLEAITTAPPSVTAAPGSELLTASLQRELDRILAFTPIVFDSGQRELSENHDRVLNNVAALLLTSPGIPVTIVGYTDDTGSAETNLELSTVRATAVYDYLVAQGVPSDDLRLVGRGQAIASGTADQSGLERRVEFEVANVAERATPINALQVGVVTSSASNDLAFTQSMVDSLSVLSAEREGVTVSVVDNMIVPADAATKIREMAQQGYGLVIAHDPRLGALLGQIAAEYPDVAFAWGPTTQAPALPNIYTYTVAAEQGGYVLGALAANVTESDVLGVVGPIEAGDAQRYVAGFEAGAQDERPGITVLVTYTGSFLDASLAAEAAERHIGAGADVITGVGPVAAGALTVATENDIAWMGTYVEQSAVDPGLVVASQVYHWEVPMREILDDIEAGGAGRAVTGTIQNGAITVQLNPAYALQPALADRFDELIASIADATIVPPTD